MGKDYYKILGLERSASEDEIKQAYRRMARKYHPDVSKEADADDRFKEANEAYEVLKDPEKRAAYDLSTRSAPVLRPVFDRRPAGIMVSISAVARTLNRRPAPTDQPSATFSSRCSGAALPVRGRAATHVVPTVSGRASASAVVRTISPAWNSIWRMRLPAGAGV